VTGDKKQDAVARSNRTRITQIERINADSKIELSQIRANQINPLNQRSSFANIDKLGTLKETEH
jgi:hypothetical protein